MCQGCNGAQQGGGAGLAQMRQQALAKQKQAAQTAPSSAPPQSQSPSYQAQNREQPQQPPQEDPRFASLLSVLGGNG